ncbi:MAG: Outer rane lipoprotein omp16 precursor [Myxococcaceae bacterium]|nr:Outer rane lipoprotein omp16 precursor [Myxococcaceae bacterium]MEA2751008.1 OmpA-OmpF porin, family [Myxococcales bacterium]
MRARFAARAALVVGAATFGLALDTPASAQSAGFAVDRFDPSERGSDWFTVESLDLRGHVRPALGLVLDYAYRPLAFYDQNGNLVTSLVDNQLFAHIGGSLVLWDRVRLGVNLPIALYQNGDSGTLTGAGALSSPTSAFAAGDLRLGADLRLAGVYGGPATLGIGVQAYLPTGSRGSFTGDESVRVAPRVMVAGDVGAFAYAARIGIMYRGLDDSFGGTRLGTEMPFAASAGLRGFNHKLLVGPEVFGTTTLDDPFAKTSAPLEILLGAHFTIAGGLRAGLGGGTGLTRGLGAPTARFVGNIEWAPGIEEAPRPTDRDGDGVFDNEDACPDVPGVRTDDPATNGCPPDRDKDGIIDSADACPDVPGVKTSDPKTNGCPPDRDGDGVLDSVDACPDVPGVKTSDPKTNGCPPDRDGDGVLDVDDACPDVPGIKTSDPKTNGCPDPDRDKDGIVNAEDACPDEPGPRDPDPKRSGCPKAFVAAGQIKILDQVKFKTGSTQILPGKESEDVLQAVLGVLKQHAEIKKITVEGHTDNVGAKDFNKKLSEGRAASVVAWLTSHGIDASRLSSAGFGLERPLDSNATEAGRKNNRRVEFHIEQDNPTP